jgi:flavin-dependent dehydrogenase
MFDVVVVGGGPGGSVCAARLAQHGRKVVVLERDRFPRWHLGESLLPQSMGTLDAIGVLPEVRERFMLKLGAQFRDEQGRTARFVFADAFDQRWPYAFQVPRDEFDDLLFRHAGKLGADLREGWRVTRILFDGDRACGVEATDPDGTSHTIEARFVVDATGREASMARVRSGTKKVPGLENTAFYTQYRGAYRDEGDRAGDIIIPLVEGGWFWFIPFKDGRTSVGAVMQRQWTKQYAGESPEQLFERAVTQSTVLTRLLDSATKLFPPGAVADFTFLAREPAGNSWLTVGDASGFIDPLFSSGAHVAMTGGHRAADALHAALTSGNLTADQFDPLIRTLKRGTYLFIGVVQSFYEGTLVQYLFAEQKREYLKRAITSMLAGDVFDEARWSNDLTTRFAPRLDA